MADTFNSEINVGPPPVALPKRRRFGVVGVVALLLILGAAGGYLWLNYEPFAEMAHSLTGSTGGQDGAPVLASAPAEGGVSAADFAAFQQQTGNAMQATTDLLTAQQTELKRLSDQIQGLTTQVAGLASKLDQLPGRGPAPQAAAPVTAPVASALARPVPVAPRKRPAAERPAGAISVGGAPLPPQPAR